MNRHHSEEQADLLARALTEIRRLKAERVQAADQPIAVIGMACRFPGGLSDPDALWDALCGGSDMIQPPPADRYPAGSDRSPYVQKAGFMGPDIYGLDGTLFRISPKEAERMDPQQKLFLKVCWEALERAGYPPTGLSGADVGVFGGLLSSDYYADLSLRRALTGQLEPADASGGIACFLTGRVSYFFGFHGPSVTVDTACSSSLVAIDQAIKALRAGDCSMALAGGVNLLLDPIQTELMGEFHILSPDCTIRPFAAGANGTVRGEGCGIVLLKPLRDAERDGDLIHAVILGGAVNQDGPSSGLTAPYGPAQEKLLARAWQRSGISADDVTYIEAHGTGTELGDPIEVMALRQVIGAERRHPLYLGTVKSNFGHLEAAAGVAGFMKAVLMVEHGQIPPNLHYDRPSPHIPWDEVPIRVPTALMDWPAGAPRIAGVSSFGLSGTNAHLVVRAYEPAAADCPERRAEMPVDVPAGVQGIKFSSMQPAGLKAEAESLLNYMESHGTAALSDLAASQNTGKADLPVRAAVFGADAGDIRRALSAWLADHPTGRVRQSAGRRQIYWMFTGQGSQYTGMTRRLYEQNRVYRSHLDACSAAYEQIKGRPLTDMLWTASADLNRTCYTQPALFAVEYALARLLMDAGIRPAGLLGHSVGEYVAAAVAGVFSLAEGMRLIAARGELMDQLTPAGKMAALFLSRSETLALLNDQPGLSVAASNGPSQTVISGAPEAVETFCAGLKARGGRSRVLSVERAFHSEQMRGMLADFRAVAETVTYHKPAVRVISNLSGRSAGAELCTPDYWCRHILGEVRFMDSIRAIQETGPTLFLEVGPDGILSGMVQQILGDQARTAAVIQKDGDDAEQLMRAIFAAYLNGAQVDWHRLFPAGTFRRHRPIPYRFQEQHHQLPLMSRPDTGMAAAPVLVPVPAAQQEMGCRSASAGATPAPEAKPRVWSRESIREMVAETLQDYLGIDCGSIGEDDNLLAFGLNSIMLTRMVGAWRETLGGAYAVGPFFARCSVRAWVQLIMEHLESKTQAAEPAEVPFTVDSAGCFEPFQLNPVQRAYWSGRNPEIVLGGRPCYAGFEIEMTGLDPDRFRRTLEQMTERHSMLRCIIDENGTQRFARSIELPYVFYPLDQIENMPAHLEQIRTEIGQQMLPLGAPLFDMRLTERGDGRWTIHFGIDFMIADALSLFIFWQDFSEIYKGVSLPPIEPTYRDYLLWQSRNRTDGAYETDRRYWLDQLAAFPKAPALPILFDQAIPGAPFRRKAARLDDAAWRAFAAHAAGHGLTPSMALFSLYAEVLSFWGGGEAFGVMLTVFEREPVHSQIERLIGDFTRLMLVPVDRRQVSYRENAAALQQRVHDSLSHSRFSGVDFLAELKQYTGETRHYPVVFTSALGVENLSEQTANPFMDHLEGLVSCTPQVALDHQVYQSRDGVILSWDYLDAAFPPNVVADMFEAYAGLVRQAAADADFWNETAWDLRPADQRAEMAEVNQTDRPWDQKLLVERFLSWAAAEPDRPAVVCGGRTCSYGRLKQLADRCSRRLLDKGVQPGELVAVQMAKSTDQIAVVIGILQLGCVYVPFASGQPAARTAGILESAGIRLIWVDQPMALADGICQLTGLAGGDFSAPDSGGAGSPKPVSAVPEVPPVPPVPVIPAGPAADPAALAYVIYTSGSTGEPKGVAMSHGAFMNTVVDVNRRFAVDADDRVLGVSSLSFDLSVYDIAGMLGFGGALILPTETERMDPIAWKRLMIDHGVTIWNSVPALFTLLLDHLEKQPDLRPMPRLKQVYLSGDWIPLNTPERLRALMPDSRLISMGGATEAAIWSNYYVVDQVHPAWRSIPYGYPLSNQRFEVLDGFGRPRPRWVAGRLHIGGEGLAQGYYNDAEQTARAFAVWPRHENRLYDTGDEGRYMSGGVLEFLGRKDQQIKLNGYRIEIGEIQKAFQKIGFPDCVILPVGAAMSDKYLAAFTTGDFESAADLKDRLSAYLPEYFIPRRIIHLDAWPVTPNGKINRPALLAAAAVRPRAEPGDGNGTEPAEAGAAETAVLELIRSVFQMPQLKADDAFDRIGISSVDMIRLANELDLRYGKRPSVGKMMRYETVSELMAYYRGGEADGSGCPAEAPPAEPAPETGAAAGRPAEAPPAESAPETGAAPAPPVGGQPADGRPTPDPERALWLRHVLVDFEAAGISLWTSDQQLKFRAAKGLMTPERAALLKAHKADLIDFIETEAELNRLQAFPLTPIQKAYSLGRESGYELGGTPAFYYAELAWPGLDRSRLEQAVRTLIEQNDILRTIVVPQGRQRVLASVPPFVLPVTEPGGPAGQMQVRQVWTDPPFVLGKWPMFHIQVTPMSGGPDILHIVFDCILLDGWSVDLLLQQLYRLYGGGSAEAPGMTFRDYVLAQDRWLAADPHYARAKDYWQRMLPELPPAPQLPTRCPMRAVLQPHFKRCQAVLAASEAEQLEARCRQYGLTLSGVLCTAYMRILSAVCRQADLTLNLTLFNRLPIDPAVHQILGDFTNVTLIPYHGGRGDMLDQLRAVQAKLWEAVEARSYNGLNLLKDLSDDQSAAVMPVVFTSLLFGGRGDAHVFGAAEEVFGISQTPQVALDHQAMYRNGGLVLLWDYVSELFDECWIGAVFEGYIGLIRHLASAGDWSRLDWPACALPSEPAV